MEFYQQLIKSFQGWAQGKSPKKVRFVSVVVYTFLFFLPNILNVAINPPIINNPVLYLLIILSILPAFFIYKLIYDLYISLDETPRGNLFSPLISSHARRKNILINLIPRKQLVSTLYDKIFGSENSYQSQNSNIFCISGTSGVGKSILIRQFIDMVNEKNKNSITIPDPLNCYTYVNSEGFNIQLKKNFLPAIGSLKNPNQSVLLIIDQLEQLPKEKIINNIIPEIERNYKNENVIWLFSIMSNFYYNLRFFYTSLKIEPEEEKNIDNDKKIDSDKDIIKIPNQLNIFRNTLHIPELNFNLLDDSYSTDYYENIELMKSEASEFKDRLLRVFEDSNCEVLREIKQREVSPLEIEMIGFMQEDLNDCVANKQYINRKIEKYIPETAQNNIDAYIYRYFLRYLYCSGDFDAAKVVLYALSVNGTLTETNTVSELAKICHFERKTVSGILAKLEESGLVEKITGRNDTYRLAHDFLAKKYNQISAHLVDPIERDIVKFFSKQIQRDKNEQRNIRTEDSISEVKSGNCSPWISYLYICIFVLLTIKLFLPADGLIPEFKLYDEVFTLSYYNSITGIINAGYLPSYIASIIAAFYVWSIYRHFFSQMEEYKLFSLIVILSCAVFIIAGAWIVHGWLILACFGGFLVGWRIYRSYKKAGIHWITNKVNTQRRTATMTFVMMLVTLILGVILFIYSYLPNEFGFVGADVSVVIGEFCISFVFFFFMVMNFRSQATSYNGAFFLGIWDRLKKSSERIDA